MLKEQKEVLAKAAQEMAYNFEKMYGGCSQAVARAVMHALGICEEAAFAGVFPMAGGIGLRQETCGALLAGIMCLGIVSEKYGRPWEEFNRWDANRVLDALTAVGAFYDRCNDALGGRTNCREITNMSIRSKEDLMKFKGTPSFETCCLNCGKIARMVVETLLEDEG